MKKKVFRLAALAYAILLCGCGDKEEFLIPEEKELIPVQFNIGLKQEVLPFPDTKSIPPLNVPEPSPVKSSEEEQPGTEALYSRIDYVVYSDENPDTPLKRKSYTTEDPDFTIVYDSLPAGDYHICFLAHSDHDIAIAGKIGTFQQTTDAFHLYHPLKVQPGEQIVQDVTLQRIVSKIEFVSTDAVPEGLKQLSLRASGYPDKIDLTTGEGIASDAMREFTFPFTSTDVGKTGLSHAFFTFVPPTGSTLSVHLSAIDERDEVVRERDVTDIQPIRNYIIRYTGLLYTPKESDNTFTLDILNDGEWESTQEEELTEE